MCEVYIVKEIRFSYNIRHRNVFKEKIPMAGTVPSLGFFHFKQNKIKGRYLKGEKPEDICLFLPYHPSITKKEKLKCTIC